MAFEDSFDIRSLTGDGKLNKTDYNNACRLISKALFPFRISSIRRELSFNPAPYEAYLEGAGNLNMGSTNPFESDDLGAHFFSFEFETVPFQMHFVPELQDEYFVPNTIPGLPHDRRFLQGNQTQDGMLILDPGRYRSLVYTGYEVNKYLTEKIKQSRILSGVSSDLSYAVLFYGSVEEANPTFKVGLTISIFI